MLVISKLHLYIQSYIPEASPTDRESLINYFYSYYITSWLSASLSVWQNTFNLPQSPLPSSLFILSLHLTHTHTHPKSVLNFSAWHLRLLSPECGTLLTQNLFFPCPPAIIPQMRGHVPHPHLCQGPTWTPFYPFFRPFQALSVPQHLSFHLVSHGQQGLLCLHELNCSYNLFLTIDTWSLRCPGSLLCIYPVPPVRLHSPTGQKETSQQFSECQASNTNPTCPITSISYLTYLMFYGCKQHRSQNNL